MSDFTLPPAVDHVILHFSMYCTSIYALNDNINHDDNLKKAKTVNSYNEKIWFYTQRVKMQFSFSF